MKISLSDPVSHNISNILVVTTIEVEAEAVDSYFGPIKRTIEIPSSHELTIRTTSATYPDAPEFMHLHIDEAGPAYAASGVSAVLSKFPSIEYIFVVGVCASIPNNKPDVVERDFGFFEAHAQIFDVIVSTEGIVDYSVRKFERDGDVVIPFRHHKSHQKLPTLVRRLRRMLTDKSFDLREIATRHAVALGIDFSIPYYFIGDGEAIQSKQRGQDNAPFILNGAYASSTCVMKNSLIRDWLKDKCKESDFNLLGLEMEGAGGAVAAYSFGKHINVVKCGCDYGDEGKASDYQPLAAFLSMAVVNQLMLSIHR